MNRHRRCSSWSVAFKDDDAVDRWQLIHFQEPSHFMIDVGCAIAGTGATEGDRSQGVTMFSNHTLTPETESTTHYFWHHARDFRLDEPELTEKLAKATSTAFGEDVIIIETQQNRMERAGRKRPSSISMPMAACYRRAACSMACWRRRGRGG